MINYYYDGDRRLLVLYNEHDKPYFAMSGPVIAKFMETKNTPYEKRMAIHTRHSLLSLIKKLNEWLFSHENEQTKDYKLKQQNRDYYVNKLLDLEQSGLMVIRA